MSKEFTQGVCEDGAAIIRNGKMLTIEEVLALLNEGRPNKRIIDLAERLVAAGPKAHHVSASECHEIRDFIVGLQP